MHYYEKTLYDYLKEFSALRGDDEFLSDENACYTVRGALKKIECLATELYSFGVREGDYVLLRATRSMNCSLIYLALTAVGAVSVLADPHFKAKEFLSRTGVDIQVKFTVTNEDFSDDISESYGWKIYRAESFEEIDFGSSPVFDESIISIDSKLPSAIIFTSGSTGASKAVVLSQYNIVNNSEDTKEIGWYVPEDKNIELLPIHHIFGLALICTAIVTRHAVFFPTDTDIKHILYCIEKYKITRMNGVPTLYIGMADVNEQEKRDLSSFRTGLIGAGPCTFEQKIDIEKRLGMTLIPVYGMSEFIGISCGDYRDSAQKRLGGVGRFYSFNTGKIELDDGSEAKCGEEGEICAYGPARMIGYFGETPDDRTSFVHTGDIGYLDEDGYLHITGRKKDIIIRNGENLSCGKIENAILSLPSVRYASVVGVNDALRGEIPCAMIEVKYPIDEVDVRAALKDKLTKIEMPEKIIITDKLPLTSSGKADKQKIKDMFA